MDKQLPGDSAHQSDNLARIRKRHYNYRYFKDDNKSDVASAVLVAEAENLASIVVFSRCRNGLDTAGRRSEWKKDSELVDEPDDIGEVEIAP